VNCPPFLRSLAPVLALCLLAAPAHSQEDRAKVIASIPLPAGLTAEKADLTLRGRIAGGLPLYLDLATLQAFPQSSFACVDPWDGKRHLFTGILISDLLARAGIEAGATRIVVEAKNKYSIPIRRADWERYGYMLAFRLDDRPFSEDKATRNRGLLIVAIDFAKYPELDPELYKHQLVWQVADILVE